MGNKRKKTLQPRYLLTIGIILLIRIGVFLPVPGIDLMDVYFYLQRNPVAKNLISTFSGEDTFAIGLFTLNIFPYINATIFVQLLIAFSPQLAKLQKEGDFDGKRKITWLTRFITLILAFIQGTGIALSLKPVLFTWNTYLASEIVVSLTTGAMIVLWLSEKITDYGFGNGTSLLIYINIVSNLPNFFKNLIRDNSEIPIVGLVGGLFLISMLSFYGIVFLQTSQLRIPLISARQLNQSSFKDRNRKLSYLPLRFNQAGVMPIILTTSFLVVPKYLFKLGIIPELNFLPSISWIENIFYWLSYIILIIVFSSFYSSIILNPKDLSDQLQKTAVKIPGVRTGVSTIFYLKKELKRITVIGAILLAIITIIPNFMESTLHLTSLNGLSTTSFLIVGGIIIDLKREFENISFSRVYRKKYR